MKKLVKLVVVGIMMFSVSAFAEKNNNAATVIDGQICADNMDVFGFNYFITVLGESVHVVANKNMTKAVCKLIDTGYWVYGTEKVENTLPQGCEITIDGTTVFTQNAVQVIPTMDDYLYNDAVVTIECTIDNK